MSITGGAIAASSPNGDLVVLSTDRRFFGAHLASGVNDDRMAYMYILECADGSYYVGSTRNLEQRVWQHNNDGGASYTRHRRPVRLVYFEEFTDVAKAFAREKQVQGWSRAKRAALIAHIGVEALPALSRKNFDRRDGGGEG